MAALGRTGVWAGGSTLVAVLCAALATAHADEGLGRLALPGADRVVTPVTAAAPYAFAASGGYGITESQSGEGAHHRLSGSAAAGFAPLKQLALSLAFDGRYDLHPGADSGGVGSPQLSAVGGLALPEGWRLGGLLQLTVPGQDAPSIDFGASVLNVAALASWDVVPDLSLAGLLGFRFDASAHAAPEELARLSRADRLALGLSDFNAIPFGLALFQRLDGFELIAELSGEILVGAGAPSLLRSPLRAAAIGRWWLLPGLNGEVLFELGLSDRPRYSRIEPLIPLEPRASLLVGLRYAPAPVAAPRLAPAPPPPPPPMTLLHGQVLDQDGEPLSGVVLALQFNDEARYAETAADGGYEFSDLPRASARLTAQAPGLLPLALDVVLNASEQELSLRLRRSEAAAQLRGLVRSFAGAPLSASVRVLPGGQAVTADKDGRFVMDLPAGEYQVEIECSGYLTQRRKISVQDNGVTLLNVELHEGTR